MLRILHSLPRTHKFLLLPIATMVTVLGAHQIVTSFDTSDVEADSSGHSLSSSSRNAVPFASVSQTELAPLAHAGTSEAKALHDYVPLSQLAVHEIVDIDFIGEAQADGTEGDKQAFQAAAVHPPQATPPDTVPAGTKQEKVKTKPLHLAMQLPDDETIGGTSYEDISIDPVELSDGEPELEEEIAAQQVYVPDWESYTIQPGDTFAVMAERNLGLGYSDVMRILATVPDKNVLTRWRVGHSFDYKLDENGSLLALRVMKNARDGYLIERGANHEFSVADIVKASESTQRLFSGTVSGSFALSAEATGLSTAEVAELTAVLSKKINFRRDTRRGDRFQVLVESDMIEGQALDSRILAAHYEGNRKDLTVIRNSDNDRFYTPDGHSLDPAFNRYPFAGSYRVSSPFNLRRHHPITGRISPHRGTDFAMHTGTTVVAPADGRVVKAAFQAGGAGKYLVIQHDNGYKTRYMHLSKTLVKVGQRVAMGDRIALSGNTGGSTGPHLHYEVMVNNRQVDAMRVKLPESQSLSGQALAAFKQESKQLLAKLNDSSRTPVVASRSKPDNRPDGT
ncbi:peptidoglycan DD-metalloendopeptidase family protein [Halomonas shantousis]